MLDPFAGSGTTLAVARKLGRQWIGCELSEEYVRAATARLSTIQEGDSLDGPADPIASAPSTANGRKLKRAATGELVTDRAQANSRDLTGRRRGPASRWLAANGASKPGAKGELRDAIREALVDAFYATHDGYSIDWLLSNPLLQSAFHEACRNAGLIGGPADWNRELLRLRKTGGFPKRGRVKKVPVTDADLDACSFAAEIAWRLTSDKFHDPSLDEILCDPEPVSYFDRIAKRFAPGFEPSQYRWAALRLRKAGRALVEEVKKYHFVFATRDFRRFQAWHRVNPSRQAGKAGIYLLRDAAKQPLYIGHALDLAHRLAQHADCRAIDGLSPQVSIIAGADLPSEQYGAAFKEELVRRYGPRWNVNLVGLRANT